MPHCTRSCKFCYRCTYDALGNICVVQQNVGPSVQELARRCLYSSIPLRCKIYSATMLFCFLWSTCPHITNTRCLVCHFSLSICILRFDCVLGFSCMFCPPRLPRMTSSTPSCNLWNLKVAYGMAQEGPTRKKHGVVSVPLFHRPRRELRII